MAKGPDCIPAKFIGMSTGILESYLPNIVNSDISLKYYSENAKTSL